MKCSDIWNSWRLIVIYQQGCFVVSNYKPLKRNSGIFFIFFFQKCCYISILYFHVKKPLGVELEVLCMTLILMIIMQSLREISGTWRAGIKYCTLQFVLRKVWLCCFGNLHVIHKEMQANIFISIFYFGDYDFFHEFLQSMIWICFFMKKKIVLGLVLGLINIQ